MKLFVKIFLWFMAAIALMFGVIVFVTRTFQTEPMVSRFERSTRNQLTVYGGTATQIVTAEGEVGLRAFLTRLKDLEPPRQVTLVSNDGKVFFGDPVDVPGVSELAAKSISAGGAGGWNLWCATVMKSTPRITPAGTIGRVSCTGRQYRIQPTFDRWQAHARCC